MAKIKYYKVVEADSAEELQQRINNCIKAGFEPIGGISVCVHHTSWENERKGYEETETSYTYCQAVVDYHDA